MVAWQAPSLEKFPWQKKMDEFVAPDVEGERTIYWICLAWPDPGVRNCSVRKTRSWHDYERCSGEHSTSS